MTSTLESSAPTTQHVAARTRRTLSTPAAFALLMSVIVFFLAASAAPTPLYGTYQQMWHFSAIMTTVVFGVYAVAVLVALLVVGRLSDHVGRRPVLLAAIAAQFPAMLILFNAGGVDDLLAARVLQGLATGAAAGAVGAGLLDISPTRGTLANAVSAPTGTASGALLGALFVQYLPAPTHLIYAVLLGIFAVQFLGVLLMKETVTRKAGAFASLRPEFGVPDRARGTLLVAAPVLIAGWSLAGLYGSLAPAIVHRLAHSTWLLLGGLPLFTAAGVGALTVLVTRNNKPIPLMAMSTLALMSGTAITLASERVDSLGLFFIGTVVAGIGFGASFQATIRLLVPLAHPHERAGLLSVIYTLAYLALGVPAVVAGWLVVHTGNLLGTSEVYAIFVIALAAVGLLGLVRREWAVRRDERRSVVQGLKVPCTG
jgi:MFS family permease